MTALEARYELGQRIGGGGMAEVVEGYDRKLDRRVAVKLLRSGLGDARAADRFVREARLAAGLSHPNVVAVYDVGEIRGQPYLVMELVEGRTLQNLLAERGPLPVDRALLIADAILSALVAAHARGLVHRDVKPANVLLGRDGRVKLADFGIAKESRHDALALTATGEVFGTPSYLAPEVIDGHEATARTDLYAVGVVLFEMLTGGPPFAGEHAVAVVLAHRDEPVPPLDDRRPGLPVGVDTIVYRAMEKEPGRRFPTAAAMRESLRRIESGRRLDRGVPSAGDSTVTMEPAPTRSFAVEPAPTSAPSRRKRRRWPAATVAALAGLLGVGLSFLLLSPDDDPAGQANAARTKSTDESVASTVPTTSSTLPPTTTTLPRTVDSLVGLLSASPSSFGERGEHLLDELLELQERSDPGQVFKLRRDVERWVERGELDPAIAAFALEVLGDGRTTTFPFGDGDERDSERQPFVGD